jgi:hypothetical protein
MHACRVHAGASVRVRECPACATTHIVYQPWSVPEGSPSAFPHGDRTPQCMHAQLPLLSLSHSPLGIRKCEPRPTCVCATPCTWAHAVIAHAVIARPCNAHAVIAHLLPVPQAHELGDQACAAATATATAAAVAPVVAPAFGSHKGALEVLASAPPTTPAASVAAIVATTVSTAPTTTTTAASVAAIAAPTPIAPSAAPTPARERPVASITATVVAVPVTHDE